jgi:hypothetical protein
MTASEKVIRICVGEVVAADPAAGSADCRSAWANAAVLERHATIRATADFCAFDTLFSSDFRIAVVRVADLHCVSLTDIIAVA